MDDEKKNHGLERSMEDKKNDAISKKVWMMKKKSWVTGLSNAT